MQRLKKILKSDAAQALVGLIGSLCIRLVRVTGRWQILDEEIPESFRRAGKPFIMSFWHGRLMMMPYCWRHANLVTMLVSGHRDGQVGARIVRWLGIESVFGSSNQSGAQATRQLLRLLRDGGVVAIAPDGPRGPRMHASEGVVTLARLSGAPIVPVAYAASRRRVLRSWDRFVVALPFSRGVFLWGEPIPVPRDADAAIMEAVRIKTEAAMTALTARADAMFGQAPIEPAPATGGEGPA